jgi:hypothetical protein
MSERDVLTVKVIFVMFLILAVAAVLHLTAQNLTAELAVPAAGAVSTG